MNWIDKFGPEYHDQLFDLYSHEWWTEGRAKDDVISAFDNSNVVLGYLSSEGQLLACARVLSDFTFKAFIFDVIVSRENRGSGIGKLVVDKIITHEKLKHVQRFELYCPDQIAPFYERLGFAKNASNLLTCNR